MIYLSLYTLFTHISLFLSYVSTAVTTYALHAGLTCFSRPTCFIVPCVNLYLTNKMEADKLNGN